MASRTECLQLPLWAFTGFVLAVCFVSGITGDVPGGVVYTDLHRTVQLGDGAVLKCQFYGTPAAVYWKKGNDPRAAPNLITWVEGEHDVGSCVHDKACEMNGDCSLIIKNVTIADQGRYICRVSNYLGILIHGYTDFEVYATPEEPYPFINECKENGKNCTVTAPSSLNITCTASRYFPNIDLLFLHGVQKVSTIETVEWKNDDGTKSKLIFTRAPPSKIPYVCMAFNIPGSQDERTATILVFHHHGNTTFGLGEPTESDPTLFIKIALPVGVSVVGVCSLIVLVKISCKKYRRRENGTKEDGMPLVEAKTGKISHYELWFLAGKMTESKADSNKLRDTFQELKITADIRKGHLTQLKAYQALCEWKLENREVDQSKDLEDALMNFHHDDVWKKIMDEKRNTNRKVSQDTMEHILWNIGGIEKVNQFLRKLIPDREPINANEKMVFVVEVALKAVTEWSNKYFQINPVVLMSLALEDAGCTSIERLLFSDPDESIAPIQVVKLREFTDKLTGRHYKRLAMTLKINNQKIDEYNLSNHHYVFDTRSLITEWLHEVECSNYEKRCRLDDAVIKIGRFDLQDFFKTLVDRPNAKQPGVKSHYFDHESVFDDDIPQLVKLVKWLPPDKKTQLKNKIGLPHEKDDNEDTLKDQIQEWRDSITTTSSDKVSRDQALTEFRSLRKELTNNTKYTELTLTDEEIEAVSSHVTSTDKQEELTSRLHIDTVHEQNDSFVGQLKQWSNTQAEKNCRETLQKALEQIGLAEINVSKSTTKQLDQEELSRIALNLMMADVRPIINVLGIDQEKVNKYVRRWNNQCNCTTDLLLNLKKESPNRDDFCKTLRNFGFIDIARSVYFCENVL